MDKIAAVIVTYNRINKLKRNIQAILKQNFSVSTIIIVDNNSTDGTREYLENLQSHNKSVHVYSLSRNIGGAGGFNYGLKRAVMDFEDDYFWIMDDDTIPEKNALKNLNAAITFLHGEFGFLSSNTRWINDSPALMNVPMPTRDWNEKVSEGLVKVKYATFVSLVIPRKMVIKVGLPFSQFFIWGDDVEYTSLISRVATSYFVKDSIVIHEMDSNNESNILTSSEERITRFYYDFRNRYVIERRDKGLIKGNLKATIYGLTFIFRIISTKDQSIKKIMPVIKGCIVGLFFYPKREFIE